MEREFSAGALVLRHMKGKWWTAVIEPGREGEPEDRKSIVALPKGNIDKGEKAAETAKREVREETGLEAELVTKLADVKYVYTRTWAKNERVFKIVSFFLMKYITGQIDEITAEMRHEVRRAYWLPLDEAATKLSYGGEKEAARKVLAWIKQHGEELSPVGEGGKE